MTTDLLRDLISGRSLSDNQALDLLQDRGAISDLCLSVADIAPSDLPKACAVLAEGLEEAP